MKNFSMDLEAKPKGSLVGQKRKKNKKLIYSGSSAVNLKRKSMEDIFVPKDVAHQPFRNVSPSILQENEEISNDIKAKLPKLYSAGLYKNFNSKMQTLKDKYTHLYEQFGKSGNKQGASVRQMVKDSEQLFSRTYSIKYFGVNNDQIGILSRRIPLRQSDKSRLSPTAVTKLLQATQRSQSRAGSPQKQNDTEDLKKSIDENNQKLFTSTLRSKTPDPSSKIAEAQSPGLDTEGNGENPIITGVEIKQEGLGADDNEIETKAQEFVPVPQKYDVYVVNQYFIPKHLHAAKRQPKRSQSAGRVGFIDESAIPQNSTGRRNQRTASNNRHDLKDVSKVRSTLMRSMSGFHPSSEPPLDRLLETDRFVTHELKTLLDDRAHFSYAKLLNTIQNPDLVQRMHQKREQLHDYIAKRQEKIENIHCNSVVPSKSKSEKFFSTSGKFFVQVTRPEENSMFKNYMKIKNKIEADPPSHQRNGPNLGITSRY